MGISMIVEAKWLTIQNTKVVFGIGERRLKEFHENGWVRRSGLGKAKVYCAEDIDKALKFTAAGKRPPIVEGKTN